jgi:hypothetical protein
MEPSWMTCKSDKIKMERRGQTVKYWADPETLYALAAFFKQPVNI